HKDGGKEEKLKEEKKKEKNKKCSTSVRCYFVRTESGWERDYHYDLSGHTIDQARRLFMHIHNAPTVAKYLSRFALILSKTIKLGVDLSNVHVKIIDDVPCRYESGQIAVQDGEHLIHTDGTGLISVDLARKCPTSVFKGSFLKACDLPLLIQFCLFHNGYAVKGTLLVDKRLPSETICIRPSMIKIYGDKNSSGEKPFNSLEIITTSNRTKRTLISRFLISLLHYGRVPAEYFVELLRRALEDVNKARHKPRDSLEVAFNHADLDDSMSARMILSGIQPEDEAYLQFQLALMTKEERKGLKQGRIPIDECYYLMGTTDPTGTLKKDQVCVILVELRGSMKPLLPGWVQILVPAFLRTKSEGCLSLESRVLFFWGVLMLLECFKQHKPWFRRISRRKTEQKKPQDYPGSKLERLLFREYLRARFTPSYVLGAAADCWLAFMDQLLTGDIPKSERKMIKRKMLDLVDIYYLALDAPKSGEKITVPEELMVKQYPHFMERGRYPDYHSASVLGKIYDEVTSQESEAGPSINSALQCFTEMAVSEDYKRRWAALYQEYLRESSKLHKLENKAERNTNFRELYQEYKWMLYKAEEFEYSPRERFDLFNEACAVYQVVYEHAVPRNEVSKCGFAWKVAGRALCQLYTLKHGGDTVLCSFSVLEGAFKKNRAP
uniref:RNA-dependent RNA polymerase n=2 Tax=Setaria italica TaxID=4555 RepID=K3Y3E1_SETIT